MTGHNPVLAAWLSVTRGFRGLVQVLHSSDRLNRTGDPLFDQLDAAVHWNHANTGIMLTQEPC